MILVTGTKRSGTSLWMQILTAAGFHHLGEEFPGPWQSSIGKANPRGFFESKFRQGIFYANNPDPKTGEFIHPKAVEGHVCKVFIPGVIRTDYAFVGQVVGTMRNWRDYGPSLQRLYDMEDEWLLENPPEDAESGEAAVARARKRRSPLPPPVDWFLEYYDLIRDAATRKYPINLATYERLLAEPEPLIRNVLNWIGGDVDVQAALDVVDPDLRSTHEKQGDAHGLDAETIGVFDELHDTIHRQQPIPAALVEKLNELNKQLIEEYGRKSRDRGREDREQQD